jgi:cytoskeleton protein RodZ
MPETIGQQLKQAREARNLTLKKVTQATHIQARLIEALEADDFESLPSPVQARAFLRLYAGFLDLSLDDLITRQRFGAGEVPATVPATPPMEVQIPAAEEDIEGPDAAGPAVEVHKNNLLRALAGKVRRFLSRFQRSRFQPKQTPEIAESARLSTPSEPEPIPALQDMSQIDQPENPLPDEASDYGMSNRIHLRLRSQIVFTGIGEALLQRRESLSLTLDEVENHTHVRKHYLQALEAGDFERLPSSVQTRGMLNNYARFLDMDVETILMHFAEGLQDQRLERQPAMVQNKRISDKQLQSKTVQSSGLQRYLSMDVIIGVGLVLILLVFAIWGTTRIIGLRSATTPQPTAQSISDILAATPAAGTPTPSPTSGPGAGTNFPEVSSTPVLTIPAAGQGPVQVVLIALEQTFVRVTVDGKKLFEGRVVAGTAYPFDGNSQIEILTGNGAAVSILFNQSDLGAMGSIGQVVDRIYTANAILNPTATYTPTPTITPTPTMTPRPTATPGPGFTPQSPPTTHENE